MDRGERMKNIIEWLDTVCEAKKTLFDNQKFGDYSIKTGEEDRPVLFVTEKTFNAFARHIDVCIEENAVDYVFSRVLRRSFLYKGVLVLTVVTQ
jgi:hypothetical protein